MSKNQDEIWERVAEVDCEVGDVIRDSEDRDCYYQGVVVSCEPLIYEITGIVWNGVPSDNMNGSRLRLAWWHTERLKKQ